MTSYRLSHLRQLESESIHIFREVAAQFERPVMLYSVGKDSAVMVRLARKAFHPAPLPFPLLHVDTGYKYPQMYGFRDRLITELGLDLIVSGNRQAIDAGTNPYDRGPSACCGQLKTKGLLDALEAGGFDAAFGGARRDEEKSRAKERVFSFRDRHGQWDPKQQRPELWNLYNARVQPGESIRVFPLSNWTELDIWHYIHIEEIPVVPLYFAVEREIVDRNGTLLIVDGFPFPERLAGLARERVLCRFRSLGCMPCTGAIRSEAINVAQIIEEMLAVRTSERANRVIDHDVEASMELKKREGYF